MINNNFTLKPILIHVSFWAVFFSFVLVSIRPQYPELSLTKYFTLQVVILFEMLIIFYLNYICIAPKILYSPKILTFKNFTLVFGLFLLGFLMSMIVRFIGMLIEQDYLTFFEIAISSISSLGAIFFFFIISTAIRLIYFYNKSRLKEAKLNQMLQQTKLEALKAQTKPHFLYNAFNTLYAMSETKSDLMSIAILKLSNIMRYLLKNSSNSKISIYEELSFIQDYIDFQQLRVDNPEKKIIVNIEEPTSDFLIFPTLLISFVENAFKYSNLVNQRSKITVDFKISENGFNYYVTNNSLVINHAKHGTGNETLKNILDIEYHGNYELKTWLENFTYHANLLIKNI